MAEAMIKGLLSKGILSEREIFVSDPQEERRNHLEKIYNVRTTAKNEDILKKSEIIVLAVKPQVMPTVLQGLSKHVKKTHLIISIAAGIKIDTLKAALPKGARIIRVMPNTPALVQAGASAYSPGENAKAEDIALVERLLFSVGTAVSVEERLMDAVTGLSGSGPAYVFAFIEAMEDAGVREGLPRPMAKALSIQTVLGSALMCIETGKNTSQLKEMVTSPGGTTIEGLHALEKGGFKGLIMDAVRAATEKAKKLG